MYPNSVDLLVPEAKHGDLKILPATEVTLGPVVHEIGTLKISRGEVCHPGGNG